MMSIPSVFESIPSLFNNGFCCSCTYTRYTQITHSENLIECAHTTRSFDLHFGCTMFAHEPQIVLRSPDIGVVPASILHETISSRCFRKCHFVFRAKLTQSDLVIVVCDEIRLKDYFQ